MGHCDYSTTMACVGSGLRSRFRGCLLGSLAGDCLGSPYEGGILVAKGITLMEEVVDFIRGLDSKPRKLYFTDDTAMTRSVAASLIHCKGKYSARDMAQRFSEEFAKDSGRGYGANVVSILPALGDASTEDIYAPARTQFDGRGSYGNGGAMRISPVGLCSSKNLERVIEIARESSKLTHSNQLGYCGAVLQACAIHSALHSDPATLDTGTFVDGLSRVMDRVEEGGQDGIYAGRLRLLKTMLKADPSTEDVAKKLGNDIAAHKSVPAAIYSVLRCLQPVPGIPTDNRLERTVIYAISLDGDTDTIASMAGAIAGALYGSEEVPKVWLDVCEGVDHALSQADQLFDIMVGEGGVGE
ncbi:poly(ADP-ribose) glycohydrolase ARH3-like isoform X2 [Acanthaster planci]|uniref:ADP-ribosylhydrolase ARH3 n=1 Tax=Acanthaster planci TaxID=133434 RepID=A0A8B7XJ69_ACAPL|nr:poly(ADP-ribose) glycohydrolase ARH3-like isoform X2 [Acanthaster planci]